MKESRINLHNVPFLIFSVIALISVAPRIACAGVAEPARVAGPQPVLVVPVRFPGTTPGKSLDYLRDKAGRVGRYIEAASYGKASLRTTFTDWVDLPDRLSAYAVSPQNFSVDKSRVAKLVADSLGAVRARFDLASFKVIWIVPAVQTSFGTGYGMIAYAINPGMLSNFYGNGPGLETVRLTGGGTFSGAGIVSAENAHVGHAAHDLLHALGGAENGVRVVPDLYDFDLQSAPPKVTPHPAVYATYVGVWDIMSQQFVDATTPPPMPSSFMRRQLGWIDESQIVTVHPGESREFEVAPLAIGKGLLSIRVPVSRNRFLMVDNRQSGPADAAIPTSGMIVMEIDRNGNEGGHLGHPIARVIDANPSTPTLDDAAFVPGSGERQSYVDRDAGVTITPLVQEPDGTIRVRVARLP